MYFNRSELKHSASDLIRRSDPHVLTVGLVYLLLNIVVGLLCSRLISVNVSETEAKNYLQYMMNGNYDYALQYLDTMKPPFHSVALDVVLRILMSVVSAGFIIFLLNTIRSTGPCFGNLLDGFGILLKIILLNILEAVFIALWSLLLGFPGIIAYYRYSQAIYLLIDDPSKSPMQCIRESKAMMKGHKWELFVLDLSFLGWFLLASLPVFGYAVRVWSVPYIAMTKALYYERLSHGQYAAA